MLIITQLKKPVIRTDKQRINMIRWKCILAAASELHPYNIVISHCVLYTASIDRWLANMSPLPFAPKPTGTRQTSIPSVLSPMQIWNLSESYIQKPEGRCFSFPLG